MPLISVIQEAEIKRTVWEKVDETPISTNKLDVWCAVMVPAMLEAIGRKVLVLGSTGHKSVKPYVKNN
jgi:hypothetical protein